MNCIKAFAFVISILSPTLLLLGQETLTENLQDVYQYNVNHISENIEIDGSLDEAAWQGEEYMTDFWYTSPIDDKRVEKELQTQVWISYDDNTLYIAAMCHGPGPYVVQTLKRDSREFWSGDTFSVIFDPNNQRTNGFTFGVNPSNVQSEALISGDTGRRGSQGSSGINGAWDNKWRSATKILSNGWSLEMAIPFKSLRFSENTDWGVNAYRGISKNNSYSVWSPVPVQFRSVDLGYTGVMFFDKAPEKVKSNIALIPYTLGSTYKDHEDNLPSENDFQIGGDAKVAITPTLNLDLTLNPDFSQVEVDEQVTNLTTVNLRFPERRLFFLENSDVFSDFGIPPMRPFFSRRIGLDENGSAIPILYGARLSGNLNEDLRVGIMNLQTKNSDVGPGQNYTSIAAHQRVFSRSIVKGYLHNRQAYDGGFLDDNYNRTGGLEFSYRSLDGKWESFSGIGRSYSNGNSDANWFGNIALGYDSRAWSWYVNYAGVGSNYNTDIGFMPRINHYDAISDTTHVIGFHHDYARIAYSIYGSDESPVNAHTFSFQHVGDATMDGFDLIQSNFQLQYSLVMKNSSMFSIELSNETQGLLFPFAFTDGEALPVGKYNFSSTEITYSTDRRKTLSLTSSVNFGQFYNGDRIGYAINLIYRQRPWGNFGVNFVQNNLSFPEEYGENKLFLIGPRIELNFSNNLFWTTFLQYNTQRDNFNINSRIQWRFQPLSDIFLVYTDNYAIDLWGPKNRAFVLKMNYWLNL